MGLLCSKTSKKETSITQNRNERASYIASKILDQRNKELLIGKLIFLYKNKINYSTYKDVTIINPEIIHLKTLHPELFRKNKTLTIICLDDCFFLDSNDGKISIFYRIDINGNIFLG